MASRPTVVPSPPPSAVGRAPSRPSASGLSREALEVARETAKVMVEGLRELAIPSEPSIIRTYQLPFLGAPSLPTSNAIKIFHSAERAYEVTVRTLAPSEGITVLSFDAAALDNLTLGLIAAGISTVPNGEFFLLPAGAAQVLRLTPNQALYARGNIGPAFAGPENGVICSIAGGVLTAAAQGIRYPSNV